MSPTSSVERIPERFREVGKVDGSAILKAMNRATRRTGTPSRSM
jgi:hypothetical protein